MPRLAEHQFSMAEKGAVETLRLWMRNDEKNVHGNDFFIEGAFCQLGTFW